MDDDEEGGLEKSVGIVTVEMWKRLLGGEILDEFDADVADETKLKEFRPFKISPSRSLLSGCHLFRLNILNRSGNRRGVHFPVQIKTLNLDHPTPI
jgi:hypothetical protein